MISYETKEPLVEGTVGNGSLPNASPEKPGTSIEEHPPLPTEGRTGLTPRQGVVLANAGFFSRVSYRTVAPLDPLISASEVRVNPQS